IYTIKLRICRVCDVVLSMHTTAIGWVSETHRGLSSGEGDGGVHCAQTHPMVRSLLRPLGHQIRRDPIHPTGSERPRALWRAVLIPRSFTSVRASRLKPDAIRVPLLRHKLPKFANDADLRVTRGCIFFAKAMACRVKPGNDAEFCDA